MKKIIAFLFICFFVFLYTFCIFAASSTVSYAENTFSEFWKAVAYQSKEEVKVDANFSEWDHAPKYYFSHKDPISDTGFEENLDNSYFQVMWHERSLYVAVCISDDSLDISEGNPGRDWLKIGIGAGITISGEYNTDYIAVYSLSADGCHPAGYNWEGYADSSLPSVFHNTAMVFKYQDGMFLAECRFDIKEKYSYAMTSGNCISFGVKYENCLEIFSNPERLKNRLLWGDRNETFYDDDEQMGKIYLTELPVDTYNEEEGVIFPPPFILEIPEKNANDRIPPANNIQYIEKGYIQPEGVIYNVNTEILVDAELTEWEEAPQYYFTYQDFVSEKEDVFYLSDNSYFQMMWQEEKIYFAAVIYDDSLEIADNNPGRDWLKVGINVSPAVWENYSDDFMTVFTIAADGWYPSEYNWEGYASGVFGLAFDQYEMKLRYEEEMVYVEGCFCLKEEFRDILKEGALLTVGVKYEDYLCLSSDIQPEEYRLLWGDYDYTLFGNSAEMGYMFISEKNVLEYDVERGLDFPEMETLHTTAWDTSESDSSSDTSGKETESSSFSVEILESSEDSISVNSQNSQKKTKLSVGVLFVVVLLVGITIGGVIYRAKKK